MWGDNESPYVTVATSRVEVNVGSSQVQALVDKGSEINVMSMSCYQPVCANNGRDYGVATLADGAAMVDAGGHKNPFVGYCLIPITVGVIETKAIVFLLENCTFDLLLGKPYAASVGMVEQTNEDGSSSITIHSKERDTQMTIVTAPKHNPRNDKTLPTSNGGLSTNSASVILPYLNLNKEIKHYFGSSFKAKYKPVAKRVKPVSPGQTSRDSPFAWTHANEELLTNPPHIDEWMLDIAKRARDRTTIRITPERLETMNIGAPGFLSSEEQSLVELVVLANDNAFSFETSEIGLIKDEVIPPYQIKTIPHQAFQSKSYPVPNAFFPAVKDMLRDKLNSKMLEPSNGPYSNPFFVLPKAVGHPRLLIDMQRVNAVTIRDAMQPPVIEDIVERAAGCPILFILDAHSGYDQRQLALESRDLTAFQSPFCQLRNTRSPQGATNSVPDFQRTNTAIFSGLLA